MPLFSFLKGTTRQVSTAPSLTAPAPSSLIAPPAPPPSTTQAASAAQATANSVAARQRKRASAAQTGTIQPSLVGSAPMSGYTAMPKTLIGS